MREQFHRPRLAPTRDVTRSPGFEHRGSRLESERLDDLAELLQLSPDLRSERLGRAAHRIRAQRRKPLKRLVVLEHPDDFRMEAIDDGSRRSRRCHETLPSARLEPGKAGFAEGRNV